MIKRLLGFALIGLCITPVKAQNNKLLSLSFDIKGEKRQALLSVPSPRAGQPYPLIFAFHGHGGTMQNMYRTRQFDKLWPGSISVYPQGLHTAGLLTDPKGEKTGWNTKDSTLNNRDLVFFDSLYQYIHKNYAIDKSRVFATGHSNGGGFVYFLWANRANLFRAFAPTATAAGKYIQLSAPKPCFHLMGETDPLVRPFMQLATLNRVKRLNGCKTPPQKLDENRQLFKGEHGNDLVLYTHPGGHTYPSAANQAIIDYFLSFSGKE
jgi:polyhydroxybutyrate depolymerase